MTAASKVGIIGVGAMGRMLIDAHYAFDPAETFEVQAATRNADVLAELEHRYPALALKDAPDLVDDCRMVFVCVPPLPYLDVVGALAPHLAADKILVCISNGVALDDVGALVAAPVVKVIPSVAHKIGRGVSLVTPGPRAGEAHLQEVETFLRPFALPVRVTGRDMRIAANLTGCGPAILAHFMQTLVQVSAERADALDAAALGCMVRETFSATARLIEEGLSPEEIVDEAATGGGMTEMAIETLAPPIRAGVGAMIEATQAREDALKAQAKGAPDAA